LSITAPHDDQSFLSKSHSKDEIIDVLMRLQQGITLYDEENDQYKDSIQKHIDNNKELEENNKA